MLSVMSVEVEYSLCADFFHISLLFQTICFNLVHQLISYWLMISELDLIAADNEKLLLKRGKQEKTKS